jgi:hypothetical protein
MEDANKDQRHTAIHRSHMPANSLFYEKIVPILLAAMGILTAALILFAAGVLLGIVRF